MIASISSATRQRCTSQEMHIMTFADRKAARVAQQQAEQGKNFKFRVRCNSYALPDSMEPVLPGLFASRALAEQFAFGKIPGAPVGDTGALRAMNAALAERKLIELPYGATFVIDRVEA